MGVKRPNRRDFLKRGAALAGGVTLGAAEPVIRKATASAQSIEDQSQEVPDHTVFTLLFRDHTWLNRSDHRSRGASPHDPRLGGP